MEGVHSCTLHPAKAPTDSPICLLESPALPVNRTLMFSRLPSESAALLSSSRSPGLSCLHDWVGLRRLSFNRMQSALKLSSLSVGAGHQACALCPDERPPAPCSASTPHTLGSQFAGAAQSPCSVQLLPARPTSCRPQSKAGHSPQGAFVFFFF